MSLERLLTRGRWPVLLVVLALTLWLGGHALEVGREINNESLQATSEDQRRDYDAFRATFGTDEILILSVTREGLLTAEGIALLEELTERVESMSGVERVVGLTRLPEVVGGPDGAIERALLPAAELLAAAPDLARDAIDRNPQLTGLVISRDRRTTGLAIELEDRADDEAFRGPLIERLRGLKRAYAPRGAELHLTGITVQKHDTGRLVARDQRVVLPASVGVLAVALAVVTRRRSGVLLPLGVTGIALIWTLGVYSALGYRLNVITALLPPVVMVLSIATTLHLYLGWVALADLEPSRLGLAARVLRAYRVPCLLTALTTAMGLASLAVSNVPAVRQFGLFGALGVLVSAILNLTLVPIVHTMIRRPHPRAAKRWEAARVALDAMARASTAHPGWIVLLALAVSLPALVGVGRLRNNTDLVRFLRSDAELHRDTMFIDRHLVGANAIEMLVGRRDGASLTTPEDVKRIAHFVERVRRLDSVTAAVALTDMLQQLHQAETGAERPGLPTDPDDLLYLFDLLDASERQDDLKRLVSPERTRLRISVRLHAVGTAAAQRVIDRLEALAVDTLGPGYTAAPTGSFYLVTLDSNRIVSDQVRSFALAFVMVFVALAATFRDGKLLMAAMVPNLVPILWTFGLMGWLAIDLSTATAMIASMVLGIAVDGTIHYLARFRYENRGDPAGAVLRTTSSTGRVLAIAACVLAVGFWVGALGSFKPTNYFSVLTGVSMISALVCDLLILPACLVLLRPAAKVLARAERPATTAALLLVGIIGWVGVGAAERVVQGDRLLQRTPVPSAERPQGEVRLVQRGNLAVVQTVLHSKVLKRVTGAIADKEQRNWPEDAEGHADSERYVTALRQARDRVLAARRPAEDRRRSLLIEFASGPTGVGVTISEPKVEADSDGLRLLDPGEATPLDLSPAYVERNMKLIVADAFEVSEDRAAALLGQTGLP